LDKKVFQGSHAAFMVRGELPLSMDFISIREARTPHRTAIWRSECTP
jgi:hypothetical protein